VHVGQHDREVGEQQELQPMWRSAVFIRPLRPRNGIHEIMRMMFEVQNGMVQTRNSTVCQVGERT
jgi:hypothetical protein